MTQKEINPFEYTDSNKRYYTYDYFMKRKFGMKCAKLSLDGGFTCPNKDGTRGTGGCVYCSSSGSGEFTKKGSIKEQIDAQKSVYERKWGKNKLGYVAYFQANTNTYAPVNVIEKLYCEALDQSGVVGLSIATRADALPDDVCELLGEISEKTFLTVELGLQTCHDEVAEKINRCHTTKEFLCGYEKLRKYGNIRICVHIINGLMWEDEKMMLENAEFVSNIGADGIKIHSLLVLSDSPLGCRYAKVPFRVQSREEYIRTVVKQLELLKPNIVVERLTADPDATKLLAPEWTENKIEILNGIDKLMYAENTYQGRLLRSEI